MRVHGIIAAFAGAVIAATLTVASPSAAVSPQGPPSVAALANAALPMQSADANTTAVLQPRTVRERTWDIETPSQCA